jgi:hypothetical protein
MDLFISICLKTFKYNCPFWGCDGIHSLRDCGQLSDAEKTKIYDKGKGNYDFKG